MLHHGSSRCRGRRWRLASQQRHGLAGVATPLTISHSPRGTSNASMGIQIGGYGALAPNRKSDLARLGIRAVAAGSMANFMSACIAGMFL